MAPSQLGDDLGAALASSSEAAHVRLTAYRASLPGGVLADAALLRLQTLREEDGGLDMTAAGILVELGEARHLEPRRAVRWGSGTDS